MAQAVDTKPSEMHIQRKPREPVPKTANERLADKIYWVMRGAVLINVVMMFFPAFNPARITGLMNKNLSLFSCGVSYSSIVSNFKRELSRGWVLEQTFRTLNVFSMLIIIGIVLAVAGGCMSLGNRRLKKLGLIFNLVGGVVELIASLRISGLYEDVVAQAIESDKLERIAPQLPNINSVYVILAVLFMVIAVVNFILVPAPAADEGYGMEPKFQLFLLMLPFIALAFVFSYLPLYGWRYAFFNYNPGETLTMEKFAGFKWFTSLFQNAATRNDMVRVLKNTLGMSGLGILTSWLPMAFAIFLTEIKNMRFRRFVQTFTTIPNFISWVLVYALALAIFSTDGFVNTMINNINPDASANTNYLMSDAHMWLKMLAWGTWKGVGWSAIIYIAAISGIDQGLYEAATVDGAGRFAKMWHITVPELIPTYCVLLLMSIANILSNGMEQYMVFSNPNNAAPLEVLDLYVYNLGINKGLIPLSTVIGMVKSVISVTLLFAANGVSKAIRGESIV